LKEYKIGLNASKFSLLLNQFFINSNNFINLINEILLNNYPLKFLEHIFGTLDELELKFHFLIIILKKGSALSTTSKFIIIPKGFFFSHLRSNLWINFCDKFLIIFIKTNLKNKNMNLGLIFILLIYYLEKLINLKLSHFINFQKYYSKEERLESIGNYYQMLNSSFKLYIKNNCKISKNELYFNYINISDNFYISLDFKYYINYINKIQSFKTIEFFELS
jgi:hypothetical protein